MRIIFIALLLLVIVFYSAALSRTPVHLNQDELGFSLNAYSIAKTGFDENSRFFPLYFWHLGVMWATPIIVYLTALFLTVSPLSEVSIRLPSILLGVTNIVLIYLLAQNLFKSREYGLLAAGFLALTPAHFIHSRILLDVLYIVPFVIVWLLLLSIFLERKKPWLLLVAGLVLGVGVHSYHAAKVMMPLYLLMTLLVLLPELRQQKKLVVLVAIGFIIPLLPFIPWLAQYPDTLVDQVRYTRLYDTHLGLLGGVATLLTPESITHRLGVFLAYFNPTFLFMRGDASLIHSTARVGVFLWPLALLLPLGIYHGLTNIRNRFNILLVLGFFTAPVAAALVGDHYRISRALVILPFAALLATYGVHFLLSQKSFLLFTVSCLLLIALPLQFSYFLYDYFTDYRIRSYAWFKYNIPGALEDVITQDQRTPVSGVYLDNRIDFIDRYWRFYLIKNQKEGMLAKTFYFDYQTVDLEALPKNSLILYHFDHVDGQKTQLGPFRKVANIFEPDGTSRFYIYRN